MDCGATETKAFRLEQELARNILSLLSIGMNFYVYYTLTWVSSLLYSSGTFFAEKMLLVEKVAVKELLF